MSAANAISLQLSSSPSVAERWLARLNAVALRQQMIIDISTFDAGGDQSVLNWASEQEIPEYLVLRATAETLGISFLDDLSALKPAKEFLDHTPISFARQHGVLALRNESDETFLVIGRIESWRQLDTYRRLLSRPLLPAFALPERLLERINTAYGQRTGQARSVIESIEGADVSIQVQALGSKEDLLDGSSRAPVIQLVNAILFEAVQSGASDVHIQPCDDRVVVRMRIDGILFDVHELPKQVQEEIVSRVKVQGKMNIAEKRLPQDGRATVQMGEKLVDLRIASLPSSYGERVVIRLLDKSARLYTLPELGMNPDTLIQFEKLVHLEHGLILVTGPTGSGKSTTLYAALQAINTKDRNVLTLEDPIEYEIAGVSQTQVNTKKGLTFATGLRNVLRQDPDIIMVGEIRDQETAVMGIQSALTGHLVFSTLHTNDAASAVTRLLDLGIEPYLVSSSVLAVLAQRLVRRVCTECVRQRAMTDVERQSFQLDEQSPKEIMISEGTGCEHCRGTGYRGRQGIYELLAVDDSVRSAIQNRANAAEIREAGLHSGMRLLRKDGIAKVLAGDTTIEEVDRVTMRTTL